MARKRKLYPEIKKVEIIGVAAEGKSLAKVKLNPNSEDSIVVFVPFGAPGDIVNLKIDKKKHNYAEAHITEIISPSSMRINPRCSHFGTCGGCKWQHLPYEEQLLHKRQQVVDALQRIAKIQIPNVKPCLGSDPIWFYRNKMEYTFSNKRWKTWEEIKKNTNIEDTNALGFHIPGSFDKVLHIHQCFLQDEIGDKIRNFIYDFASSKGLTFFDIKENKGLLRTLMIRPLLSGELMVCITFGENNPKQIQETLEALKINFPQITSLLYVINMKLNDSIADQEVISYFGPQYIEEKMGDLRLRISAKSFYQTNSRQAKRLYETVAQLAGLTKESGKSTEELPLVYDLYTGTGTIANFVARFAKKVIGIEYVEDAIEDAKINSRINGIENTEFYAGDMKDILTNEFLSTHGLPDIMIVDPPRAGMHEDVVNVILEAEPEIIVYVSCNPATQARDLALLDKKYEVTDVQPVDMFPHTHHVENVVRLKKK